MKICLRITMASLLMACAVATQAAPLSPARSLVGKWKTKFAVTYHIWTDYNSFYGTLENVANDKRMVTWKITPGSTSSTVNIQQTFRSKRFTSLVPYTGYTPDVSPQFYTGLVSGSRLTVIDGTGRILGKFSFTTRLMKGSWNDFFTIAYSQQVFTDKNKLKFVKK